MNNYIIVYLTEDLYLKITNDTSELMLKIGSSLYFSLYKLEWFYNGRSLLDLPLTFALYRVAKEIVKGLNNQESFFNDYEYYDDIDFISNHIRFGI